MGTSDQWDDDRRAAEVTDRQFRALAARLDPERIVTELPQLRRVSDPTRGRLAEERAVTVWLSNAWNTERVMSLSDSVLEDAGGAALQWTFPQAYYAAFAHVRAFLIASGQSETKHGPIQKNFGKMVLAGEYPTAMSFAATGTKKSLSCHGLDSPGEAFSPLDPLDESDSGSVDRHIEGFLSSTRRSSLNQRKKNTTFRKSDGTPYKNFSEAHWKRLSDNQGPTALLCLLYRKRVKSNYRDIDTFTAEGFDATGVFRSVRRIVGSLAFTHEAFVAAAMGWDWFAKLATENAAGAACDPLQRRLEHIEAVVSQGS